MKIKKMLSCLMALILMCSLFCVSSVSAKAYDSAFGDATIDVGIGEEVVTEDGLILDVYSQLNFFYIIGYEGESTKIEIPAKYENNFLQAVYLKESYIEELVFPAPAHDYHTIKFLLPGCKELKHVEFSPICYKIEEYAFYGCESLKEIEIPKYINNIYDFAFAYSGLESIEIDNDIVRLGEGAFEGCKNLKSVDLSVRYVAYTGIDEREYGDRFSMAYYIPNNLFKNCTSLKSIKLPETTKFIGEGAFQNSGLTSITIPKNVKIVYKKAFYGCKNLTSVKFAGAVNNIGRSAFSKCANLKTVNFTKGYLKKVYDYAFYKCEKLDKITISNTKNVPTIAKSAFNKAKSGIKFYVKNNTVAKKLKAKLQKTNIKKAKIYRSTPILLYKNVG